MTIVAKTGDELTKAIRELASYRKEDAVATAFNVGNSFYAVNVDWRASNPKTPAEIRRHYQTSEPQVAQQVFATYGIPGELALREVIANLCKQGDQVLDLGAGIGSQILPLAEMGCACVHADVGGVMMDYARWRYAWRSLHVELVTLEEDYLTRSPFGVGDFGRDFDVVVCTEVIEHVPDPVALVAYLATLTRQHGFCVATTSFDDGDGMVPMHLNIDKFDDESFAAEVFPRYGLHPTGTPHVFVRR